MDNSSKDLIARTRLHLNLLEDVLYSNTFRANVQIADAATLSLAIIGLVSEIPDAVHGELYGVEDEGPEG